MIKSITAKSILSPLKNGPDSWFGISYNMNLYRGCQHQCIYRNEVEAGQVRNIVQNAIYSALIILILFSIYVFFITTKRVRKFLHALQESGQKLKSAKKALQKSEENFKTLFNNTSDEIFVTSPEGKFLFVNQQACDSLGYDLDEFTAMFMEDIKSERYKSQVKKKS